MLFHLHKKQWLHPTAKEKILKAAHLSNGQRPTGCIWPGSSLLALCGPDCQKILSSVFYEAVGRHGAATVRVEPRRHPGPRNQVPLCLQRKGFSTKQAG